MIKITVSVPCIGSDAEVSIQKLTSITRSHGKTTTPIQVDLSESPGLNKATVSLEDLESAVKAIRNSI